MCPITQKSTNMHYYFITGSSRGIGKALAENALERNATVTGFARNSRIQHSAYDHILMDFSDMDDLYYYEFPKLKDADKIVLINNAGALGQVGPVGQLRDYDIEKLFNINTIASSILSNKFIKAYKDLTIEKIILNVSSGAGRHAIESWAAYCASKAAMDMFSMVTADEQKKYYQYPTHIFSVAPGIVDTQMQDEIREVNENQFKDVERFKNYKANGELASAESVAGKLFQIIDQPEHYNEVLLDVRKL